MLDNFLLNNYVSLDEDIMPQQSEDAISVLKVSAYKNFRFSIVGIDTKLSYQKASDEAFIRLPDILADVAIFVTLPLFQGAAQVLGGE